MDRIDVHRTCRLWPIRSWPHSQLGAAAPD
jgi:hypothetical protein